MPSTENTSDGADSGPAGGVPRGVPRGVPSPELLPLLGKISRLRSEQPDAAPFTLALALALEAKHGHRTTGKAIADLLAYIDAQPVEEF